MSLSPDHRTKLLRLRSAVAGLSVTLGFVRLQRARGSNHKLRSITQQRCSCISQVRRALS